MRILCLSKRWKHHTTSGGYDRMATEIGAQEVRRRLMPKVLSRLLQIARNKVGLTPKNLLDYRYEDLCAEKELLQVARETKPDVVHVLYGDEQLNYLLRTPEPLTCPLVVSFHLPTFRAAVRFDAMPKAHLARIDAVIVLATFQLKDYLAWFRADQLFYVPHGIDTERFRPDSNRLKVPGIRLATVGTHMRDWVAIERIIQYFEARDLPVRFDVVGSHRDTRFLAKYKSVELFSGLSEEALVELYQSADALLLPVVSATANNSALESLACGTPVISTETEGMPDYVNASSGWLFPKGEVTAICDLIESAVNDPAVFSAMRPGAREKSLEFSWGKIAGEAKEVYRKAIAQKKSGAIK